MQHPKLLAGRFELGELIGQGGMSDVFRGRDIQTNQAVAIKSLRTDVIDHSSQVVERFGREGRTLQHLNHKNIVKVFQTLSLETRHYIVMEYIAGGSLSKQIEVHTKLPLPQVYRIGYDIAQALAYAHNAQIFHRDIKPSNVLLTEDGTACLSDFGIAHIKGLSPITQPGTIIGTYQYLSPEACNGAAANEQTDIWSFGVLLFELLAGRRPFTGNHLQVLQEILYQPVPDLLQFCPNAPITLIEIIQNMLEKDPTYRIASAAQISKVFEKLLYTAEHPHPKPGSLHIPEHPDQSTLKFLRQFIYEKRRRLNVRQLQAAKLGFSADPSIAIEIEDLDNEIRDLEQQAVEIEQRFNSSADANTREDHPPAVLKHRRIDAALPNYAEIGQPIHVIIQIRFPNSPQLRSKDVDSKQQPVTIEQTSEASQLRFALNPDTDTLESILLDFQINAPSCKIIGATRQQLAMPPGDYSQRATFILVPSRSGLAPININVYTLDQVYLGRILLETMVGRSTTEPTTHISNLFFNVTVEPALNALLDPPEVEQRSSLITKYIQAGDIANALNQIEISLRQRPNDREMTIWLAQLIENPTATLQERLHAAEIAAHHDDLRPGVCHLPPATTQATGSYWEIARYPITCAQFSCFIEDNGYDLQQPWWQAEGRQWLQAVEVDTPAFWHNRSFAQYRNHPVVGVSWYEANAFCLWLSQSQRYNPEGMLYRLPTTSEWQQAAQGRVQCVYPWGTEAPTAARANFAKQIGDTTPVGCFVAGATPQTSLHDMAGNVYEWTNTSSLHQPMSQSNKSTPVEVWVQVCGGSWRSANETLRTDQVHDYAPDYNSLWLGFRVVRAAANRQDV